jgi:hypothetical protein
METMEDSTKEASEAFNLYGLGLTTDQDDKVEEKRPWYVRTKEEVEPSLGALGQDGWQDDLKIERLLEEGDGRIGLNVPLLMYLTHKYGGLPDSSCDLVDSRQIVGTDVGGGLGNHFPLSSH